MFTMFVPGTKHLINTVVLLSRPLIILDTDESDTPECFVSFYENPCQKEVS